MNTQQIIDRPFNLTRYFALLSLCSIVLFSSVSAGILFRYLSKHLLERDARVSMEFIQGVAQINNPEPYFHGSTAPDDHSQLQEFFEHITTMPYVLRANVYDKNQLIIWSDNSALIGQRFRDNDELSQALTGDLVYQQERVSDQGKIEHTFLPEQVIDFIESYVPIWNNEQNEVIGVVELYKSPTALFAALNHGRWLVVLVSISGALLLYLTLFWIVRRASTVIQQQQNALVENEKLSAVGELTAAISHNLRNALAAIRSSAELLQDQPRQITRKCADDIVHKVDQLSQWLRVLLVYAHTSDLRAQTVDLLPLLQTCLAEFSDRMRAQKIKVKFSLLVGSTTVNAEPEFLHHVFMSLIANALDAMPDGGELHLKIRQSSEKLMVSLHDNGHGIAAYQLQQIFRPLVSHKVGGLGVGLPLARRLLQRCGGDLELICHPNQGGTTAMVQLQAA